MRIRDILYFFRNIKAVKYLNFSFSDEGEDVFLYKLFEGKKDGFYVDIGANHPYKHSNTNMLYKMGWHGINVDAMPGSMKKFDSMRKRDINIESGVGRAEGELVFYVFKEKALNTFDDLLAKRRLDEGFVLQETIKVQVCTLEKIFDEYLPNEKQIDILDVDVEGLDLEVLKSNNWDRYRPHYVLAEDLMTSLEESTISDMTVFMKSIGYKVAAKLVGTIVYENAKK